jgi:hypothetical protein
MTQIYKRCVNNHKCAFPDCLLGKPFVEHPGEYIPQQCYFKDIRVMDRNELLFIEGIKK